MSNSCGVRTLADLKGRCRLDVDSGCWVWARAVTGAMVPCVSVPAGLLGNVKRLVMPAYKVAWALDGRSLPPAGMPLMRCKACTEALCIFPGHRKKGARALINRTAAARGSYHSPAREEKLWASRLKQALPAETVRRVERLLAGGETIVRVAYLVGIDPSTARKILDGQHIHQRRTGASSVFTWRPVSAALQAGEQEAVSA